MLSRAPSSTLVELFELTERLNRMLGDDYLRALGRITVNFSQLEGYIAFSIWNLLGTDQRLGQICTARTPTAVQLKLLAALARVRMTPPEIEQVDAFVRKAGQAEQDRNTMMHSTWGVGVGVETGSIYRSKESVGRQGYSLSSQRITAQDLEEVAGLIEEAARSGSSVLGATLRYSAPTHSVKLADLALVLAKNVTDETTALSRLGSVTGAVVESEAEFRLAQAHCLAREDEELPKRRAVELLARALHQNGEP
jgi:hypothetical protein